MLDIVGAIWGEITFWAFEVKKVPNIRGVIWEKSDFFLILSVKHNSISDKKVKKCSIFWGQFEREITFCAFGGGWGIFLDILYTSIRYGSQKPKKRKFPFENKAYFYYFFCSSDTDNIVMKLRRKKKLWFFCQNIFKKKNQFWNKFPQPDGHLG